MHLPQESLVRNGTRTSLPAKPSPISDDTGQIVHCPMGLPVAAGCNTLCVAYLDFLLEVMGIHIDLRTIQGDEARNSYGKRCMNNQ